MANQRCTSDHCSSKINAATLENVQHFIQFKNNFQTRLERGRAQWASALDKRRQIQNYLESSIFLLQRLAIDTSRQKKLNNDRLNSLNSLLAIDSSDFFSSLASFLDVVKLDGKRSLDSLTKEIQRIFNETTVELDTLNHKVAQLEVKGKTRIQIILRDVNDRVIATCPQLEQGFTVSPVSSDSTDVTPFLNLISDIVFLILRRLNVSTRSVTSVNHHPLPVSWDRPIFVLKLHRRATLLGEIHIQSLARSNVKFIGLLAQLCRNKSIEAGKKVAKVSIQDSFSAHFIMDELNRFYGQ